MRSKLKFRHDIFLILSLAGIIGLLISHSLGNWQWYSLTDLIGGINALIFFFAAVGCGLAYRFQKERLSQIFAAIGLGISVLSEISIFIIYLIFRDINILKFLSFLLNISISLILLWLYFRKK